jgi:hypothetical protein
LAAKAARGQHQPGARVGFLSAAQRIELGGCLQKARDQRRLVQRYPGRRLAEIASGRRIDPVGAGPQIDPVQIDREDLVLGKAPLEPQGEQDLLHLPLDRALRLQEQVLCQLLGDGRPALDHGAGPQITVESPGETAQIDPEVTIEAPVLHGDYGMGKVGRQVGQDDRLAIMPTE